MEIPICGCCQDSVRNIPDLREVDQGRTIFPPEPGVYANAHQIKIPERITAISKELQLEIRETADDNGFKTQQYHPDTTA